MIIPKDKFDEIFDPDRVVYIGSSPLLNAWLQSKAGCIRAPENTNGIISLTGETTTLLHTIAVNEGIPENQVLESMVFTYASAQGYTEK